MHSAATNAAATTASDGLKLDVFVETFSMCHDVPLGAIASVSMSRTVPFAELLLTKAQIVELNDKDAGDLFVLFHDHDLTPDETGINYIRIGELCGRDWGLWRTVTGTLGQLETAVGHIETGDRERALVISRVERLLGRNGRGAKVAQVEDAQIALGSEFSGTCSPRSPTKPSTSGRCRRVQIIPLGLVFPAHAPAADLPAFARRAEQQGYAELWVVEDCFLSGGLAMAATALAATERIHVGIGLLPALVSNPAIAAMEISTIARIHPSRLTVAFGNGVSAWMTQIGARPERRLAGLKEVVIAVRSLLAGERSTATVRMSRSNP